MVGMSNPMDNEFVQIVLEGAKRTVGKPPSQQKEPTTVEMAKSVVELLGSSNNLMHHRTVVICLLGFSGFLRISELIEIQVKHLSFHEDHLGITIPEAKNDQVQVHLTILSGSLVAEVPRRNRIAVKR